MARAVAENATADRNGGILGSMRGALSAVSFE